MLTLLLINKILGSYSQILPKNKVVKSNSFHSQNNDTIPIIALEDNDVSVALDNTLKNGNKSHNTVIENNSHTFHGNYNETNQNIEILPANKINEEMKINGDTQKTNINDKYINPNIMEITYKKLEDTPPKKKNSALSFGIPLKRAPRAINNSSSENIKLPHSQPNRARKISKISSALHHNRI